jgi:hypothetical protein
MTEPTENADDTARDMLRLPYFAALTGFVAAIFPLAALAIVGGVLFPSLSLLFPIGAVAAVVTIFFGLPMHGAITVLGLASRWWYVTGMLLIIGASYFLLFGNHLSVFDVFLHPIGNLSFLIPVAAIPSGLFFHWLLHRAQPVPSASGRDFVIVIAWFGVLLFALVVSNHGYHAAPDPQHTRSEITRLASAYGVGAFSASMFVASLVRLWSVRFSSLVAGLSLGIPAAFFFSFFQTPLGPEILTYKIGNQTFAIDWRPSPRSEGKDQQGFSFDPRGRGPFEIAGRRQLNRRLYVSESNVFPSEQSIETMVEHGSPPGAGLMCKAVEGEGKGQKVCVVSSEAGRMVTLIECRPGYCVHRFENDGLYYRLLIDDVDIARWKQVQERSIALLNTMRQ